MGTRGPPHMASLLLWVFRICRHVVLKGETLHFCHFKVIHWLELAESSNRQLFITKYRAVPWKVIYSKITFFFFLRWVLFKKKIIMIMWGKKCWIRSWESIIQLFPCAVWMAQAKQLCSLQAPSKEDLDPTEVPGPPGLGTRIGTSAAEVTAPGWPDSTSLWVKTITEEVVIKHIWCAP